MSIDGHHPHDDHEHPRDRAMEADDPMLLNAQQIDGDPEVMLDCLVEEFARMGSSAEEIVQLFDNPFYQATAGLTHVFGREGVRRRIAEKLGRFGVLRVTQYHAEPDPEAEALDRERPVSLTVHGHAVARD